jgi:hypothetical protein
MCAMTDPRAAVEFRLPAADLRPGDLVNTSPGEDDWQEVVGVFRKPGDAKSTELKTLTESLGGRYIVVQLTDLAPVDGGIYFDGDGAPMVYAEDDGDDHSVADIVSSEDGIRTYLYTKYELVSVRAKSG